MTCARTQGFLAKHKVTVGEQADAKKATIKGAAALDVLRGVDEMYVAKGKKVEHVDLKKAKPDRATLLETARVPAGRLCAPEDVLGAVDYLLSAEAGFVTGQLLPLTGGRL